MYWAPTLILRWFKVIQDLPCLVMLYWYIWYTTICPVFSFQFSLMTEEFEILIYRFSAKAKFYVWAGTEIKQRKVHSHYKGNDYDDQFTLGLCSLHSQGWVDKKLWFMFKKQKKMTRTGWDADMNYSIKPGPKTYWMSDIIQPIGS